MTQAERKISNLETELEQATGEIGATLTLARFARLQYV